MSDLLIFSKEMKYLEFDGRPPKFYMLVIIFKKELSASQTNKNSVIRFNSKAITLCLLM